MVLVISGVSVEICKKDIINLHFYVKPPKGEVSVSAPLSMSDETIERFIRKKINWIKKKIDKFNIQSRRKEREYVSGETLYVWGKQYLLKVKYGKKYALKLLGDKAIFTVLRESAVEQREGFIREWYRSQLKVEVTRLLPKWEKITGLKCNNWQTKYMKTRWGTCNRANRRIWLNPQLAKKTSECLESVILHELLHFIEKYHNEHFYSLMDKYMPKWRGIKTMMNKQSIDFME